MFKERIIYRVNGWVQVSPFKNTINDNFNQIIFSVKFIDVVIAGEDYALLFSSLWKLYNIFVEE